MHHNITLDNTRKNLSDIFSLIGFIVLFYGFITISKGFNFPGKWAVIPVTGTVFLILAGPNAFINRVTLSNQWIVWLGLISFPLYLWHWPLLTFARILESDIPDLSIRLSAVAISIALAWGTYKFIERPIRMNRATKTKVFWLAFLMVLITGLAYGIYAQSGLPYREAEQNTKINKFERSYKQSCEALTGEVYSDDWCNVGTSSRQAASTVMVGDSFANAYSTILQAYAQYA